MATLALSHNSVALKSFEKAELFTADVAATSRASFRLDYRTNCDAGRLVQQQRIKRTPRATAGGEAGQLVAEKEANALVDQLLHLVQNSDRGASLKNEQHAVVSDLVSQLERLNVPSEPLQSPLIFGEWDVEYCSNPTAPGGYYRSAIGRLFLKTEEMIQTLEAPDNVGNSVAFAAFGSLQGQVSLKGRLVSLDKKWIEITFEPPYLKLGPIETRYGKGSKVKIAILYVDERIRLGRGSRGSVFVFKRREPSNC